MGGFDFLIAFNDSALAFSDVTPGAMIGECAWEYFTYRFGPPPDCGDACPSGMVRIVTIADLDNGMMHPECFGPNDTEPQELARIRFVVTNDRTFECSFVPIRFFWADCGDNGISSISGDTLFVSAHVFEYSGIEVTDPNYGFPTYFGIQSYCIESSIPDKPLPIPYLNFMNGGVSIICAESLDVRGDVNLNGVPYEIADASVFVNYFLYGLQAFAINIEGQIAATEINADGVPLTVADLTFLMRIITHEAFPIPKSLPAAASATVALDATSSSSVISTESFADIGAAFFEIKHAGCHIGAPHLLSLIHI